MKRNLNMLSGVLLGVFLLVSTAPAADQEPLKSGDRQESGNRWEEIFRTLRNLGGRPQDQRGTVKPRPEPSMISLMLHKREKLGLSAEQVRTLEQWRSEYDRESIRRSADLKVAEMDLTQLTNESHVDLKKVEDKVREIERLRGAQTLARIRTNEKGKGQLTADQRKKLQDMIGEPAPTRAPPKPER